ncbi:hypothetical protein PYCC9005_005364 [Savitreella phatthalungensis]
MSRPYLCYSGGPAELYNERHPSGIDSLNQLIEERAETFHGPIIGQPSLLNGVWSCELYTYKEVLHGVNAVCEELKDVLGKPGQTVALVAPSNLDLMFTMLAVQRLGHSALQITPQQTTKVISHLCELLEVKTIISTLDIEGARPLPPSKLWRDGMVQETKFKRPLTAAQERDLPGIVYHSSGTTSGLPKPLPTAHRHLTTVNAHIPSDLATLTTTPLNTGGSADLCRSMCSNAPLFIFPDNVSITTEHVLAAHACCEEKLGRPVQALSCVPYIAKMLAEDERGLAMMARLDMVGVGGAPLPKQTGDDMTRAGVFLVSRMGSSECGFLMSSWRPRDDPDWDFLRSEPGGRHFRWLEREGGAYELEIHAAWPALAVKPNHEGSYRSGDLFEPHPTTPHAWRYLGRNDDVITLESGKKADPKALEGLLRGLPYIRNGLVFGVGKNHIGALVLEGTLRREELLEKLWPEIERYNATVPSHSQLYRDMIVILPRDVDFMKTPKGTVFRKGTYTKFEREIEAAYDNGKQVDVDDDDLERYVLDRVCELGKPVGLDDDLFNAGINSIRSARIGAALSRELAVKLPSNIVYEEPSARRLAAYILRKRGGDESSRDPLEEMRAMAKRYVYTEGKLEQKLSDGPVLVTGCTGGLGSHLLRVLANRGIPAVGFVRGAVERMAETYAYRKIDPPDVQYITSLDDVRPSIIIHCAWPVNFNAGLPSFEDSLKDLAALLQLATRYGSTFFFCSSTAAAGNARAPVLPQLYDDPAVSAGVGYARSKWVAEQVTASYAAVCDVHILRIGQLYGDTRHGVWSEREGWPLLFAASRKVGSVPELPGGLSWLPVDTAAESIIDIMKNPSDLVYHIVSADTSTTWDLVMDCIGREAA